MMTAQSAAAQARSVRCTLAAAGRAHAARAPRPVDSGSGWLQRRQRVSAATIDLPYGAAGVNGIRGSTNPVAEVSVPDQARGSVTQISAPSSVVTRRASAVWSAYACSAVPWIRAYSMASLPVSLGMVSLSRSASYRLLMMMSIRFGGLPLISLVPIGVKNLTLALRWSISSQQRATLPPLRDPTAVSTCVRSQSNRSVARRAHRRQPHRSR